MRARDNRTVNQAADLLQCRFLLDGAVADDISASLAADIRQARLSRLFRAYYQFRSLIPLPIRHLLQRYRRVEAAPRWCYPDAFTTCLIRQIGALAEGITLIHPWPEGANLAFVLTHDIETAEGMRRVVQLADLEEGLGFGRPGILCLTSIRSTEG